MQILGLDIGGANIKAASVDGQSCCRAFPLWKKPSALAGFLSSEILASFPAPTHVALTMTGELCDCFEDKPDGIRQILAAVDHAGLKPFVYAVDGSFLTSEQAVSQPLAVAASNWHALANYSRRFPDRNRSSCGILFDLGSTSCDLIPFTNSQVLAVGNTDLTRMLNQELVYTGSSRTPVCAVANQIDFRGQQVPVAEEIFATMQDVYVVTGDMEERPDSRDTADGRALTIGNAQRRLARILCADMSELCEGEILELAEAFRSSQLQMLESAFAKQTAKLAEYLDDQNESESKRTGNPLVVVSGSGGFLVSRLMQQLGIENSFSLARELGPSISESAPAFAVATLLQEFIAGERA